MKILKLALEFCRAIVNGPPPLAPILIDVYKSDLYIEDDTPKPRIPRIRLTKGWYDLEAHTREGLIRGRSLTMFEQSLLKSINNVISAMNSADEFSHTVIVSQLDLKQILNGLTFIHTAKNRLQKTAHDSWIAREGKSIPQYTDEDGGINHRKWLFSHEEQILLEKAQRLLMLASAVTINLETILKVKARAFEPYL